jgi:hypothetical protein
MKRVRSKMGERNSPSASGARALAPSGVWTFSSVAPAATRAAERQLMVAVGFSPRTATRKMPRRVATFEGALGCGINRSVVAPRRRIVSLAVVRGLKPTASIVVSLRETGRKCPNSNAGFSPLQRWKCWEAWAIRTHGGGTTLKRHKCRAPWRPSLTQSTPQ